MIEINVKKARENLSALLDRIEKGEEIIITRRGKRVAYMTSPEKTGPLPSLEVFRRSIKLKGKTLSGMVVENRQVERY